MNPVSLVPSSTPLSKVEPTLNTWHLDLEELSRPTNTSEYESVLEVFEEACHTSNWRDNDTGDGSGDYYKNIKITKVILKAEISADGFVTGDGLWFEIIYTGDSKHPVSNRNVDLDFDGMNLNSEFADPAEATQILRTYVVAKGIKFKPA